MKLESLESKRLANLNNVLGGTNGITDGTNLNFSLPQPKTATCTGGCTVVVSGDNINTSTGNWTYDY